MTTNMVLQSYGMGTEPSSPKAACSKAQKSEEDRFHAVQPMRSSGSSSQRGGSQLTPPPRSCSVLFIRNSGIHGLRSRFETNLVQSMTPHAQEDREDQHCLTVASHRFPLYLFRLFGILPFRWGPFSKVYSGAVLVLACVLVICCAYLGSLPQHGLQELVPATCQALASLLALLSLHASGVHDLLGHPAAILDDFATRLGFKDQWHHLSIQQFLLVVLALACMLSGRILLLVDPACHGHSAHDDGVIYAYVDVLCAIIASCLMAVLMYLQLHVSSALEISVETFCHRLMSTQDLTMGTEEWNLLQAVLRKVASIVDGCFCILSALNLAVFVFTGVQTIQGGDPQTQISCRCTAWWYNWMMPPWLLTLYMFHRAASVTGQCSLVPSMVNSWISRESGDGVDYKTHFAVQYILHSAAGFYVKGVRVTTYMTMKVIYVLGVVTFTLISKSMLRV